MIQLNNLERLSIDKISLIFANLMPLIGVAFFDWSLFNFLFLYWLETLVIGFYFLLKIIKIARWRSGVVSIRLIGKSIFFSVHLGGFMFVHLIFIWVLNPTDQLIINFDSYGFLFFIFNFILLFVSHGVSYQKNFMGGKEYEKFNSVFLSFAGPYRRIAVMHITVILSSILVLNLGGASYFVIIVKLIVDYLTHIKVHKINNQGLVMEKLDQTLGSNDIKLVTGKDIGPLLNKK